MAAEAAAMTTTVSREAILRALRLALEPLDYVHAMWEGGAAAFDRVDPWSDLDLQVDADDDRTRDVVAAAEAVLAALSPIDLRYELPQPTWHGHWQAFYRLENASPYLLIDFVVLKHGAPEKFLQPEIHGQVVIHFDKSGVVQPPPFEPAALARRLDARVKTLGTTFDLFQTLILKELNRHNDIEALAFYNGFVLRPLVELLRIRHCPARHDFYTRYVYYDLPAPVVTRLEPLFFVANTEDLKTKRAEAARWFADLLSPLSAST
jgi:hypothetical protein